MQFAMNCHEIPMDLINHSLSPAEVDTTSR